MGVLIRMKYGNYTNKGAVENVVRYITRSRDNERDADALISVGGAGVAYYMPPDRIIYQLEYVQNEFDIDKRGGRRLAHEVFQLSASELLLLGGDYALIYDMACALSNHYYQRGHQVVFALHKNSEGLHIHFAVNTINFRNGLKWHDNRLILQERENCFNQIVRSYQAWYYHKRHKVQAISFQ